MVFRVMRTIWQLRVVITACIFSLLVVGGGRTIAQIREASERFDRDERRIERRVDGLQKSYDDLSKKHDDLRLDIEKRLTRIETYGGIGLGLIGLLFTGVVGQWGMRLFDVITQRRTVTKDAG